MLRFGRFELDPVTRRVRCDGAKIHLAPKAFELLVALLDGAPRVVSKRELHARLWPGGAVADATLVALVKQLRAALNDRDRTAPLIRTVHRVGYALEAPLTHRETASVMVLPFLNVGDQGEQDYFADGITEDIITDLSKVSGLRVIARNSAFTLKGQTVDIVSVAQRFGVSHVLEGSVRKAGNRVRINAQLIDGSDGSHIWAERYDRDLNDIFQLQDEVTQAIVSALRVKLKPEEKQAIEDRGTDNLQAYDIYLRSRSLYRQSGMIYAERSVALAREAIHIDPEFILAYRQLAASLDLLAFLMPDRGIEIDRERQALMVRVAETAPDDPFFLFIRCRQLVCEGDLIQAEKLSATVPAGADLGTFWASHEFFGFYVGHVGAALEYARRRVQLDPMDQTSSLFLHDLLDINGLLDEADVENERSRDLPGERIYLELSSFLRGKGRATLQELRARYRRMLASSGFVATLPVLAELEPILEDPVTARRCIRKAASDPLCQDSHRQLWIAMLAAHFEDHDTALEILRLIFVERDHVVDLRCGLWLSSPFRQVRRDPRFKAILRDLGLYDYWRGTSKWSDLVRPVGEDDFEIIEQH